MPDILDGIVLSCNGGRYEVFAPPYRYSCYAKGAFRHLGTKPVAGDRVLFVPGSCFENDGTPLPPSQTDDGYLTEILPRKTLFTRPACANLDQLLIVVSIADPPPDPLYIDRLTVLALANAIRPLICFNKSDLDPELALHFHERYTNAGFASYVSSFLETTVLPEELCAVLNGKITALAGFSGVGKTSFFNRLFPDEQGEVGELSKKIQRGKNTTRQTVLHTLTRSILHVDGYLADAAGFSQLKLARNTDLNEDTLASFFPDFTDVLGSCRYTKCTHLAEDGCSIRAAVADGKIAQSRYISFLNLHTELTEQKPY